MAAQTDLWGDLTTSAQVRTPLAILREQASLLGKKTQNLVEASVQTSILPGQRFVHSFNLVVPALSNYSYSLFVVKHGIELYPVSVEDPEVPPLETEQAFMNWLRYILSSDKTKRLIGNLLAQARS